MPVQRTRVPIPAASGHLTSARAATLPLSGLSGLYVASTTAEAPGLRPVTNANTVNRSDSPACADPRNKDCACPACQIALSIEDLTDLSDCFRALPVFTIDSPDWGVPPAPPVYGPDGRDMGRWG